MWLFDLDDGDLKPGEPIELVPNRSRVPTPNTPMHELGGSSTLGEGSNGLTSRGGEVGAEHNDDGDDEDSDVIKWNQELTDKWGFNPVKLNVPQLKEALKKRGLIPEGLKRDMLRSHTHIPQNTHRKTRTRTHIYTNKCMQTRTHTKLQDIGRPP